jgi:hypothetical protein
MARETVFTSWDDTHSSLWGNRPIRLAHRLHQSDLFSHDQLARLIETYPREHYSLVETGARESRRVWREGDIGALSGAQVIDAISRGRLWLNLRNVTGVDRRYRAVVDQIFEEIAAKVPDFDAPTRQAGILISSPEAQVYYHADLPGQGLIQIAGRKRVYLYPATAPFITPQYLEDIALFDVEVNMPYAEWYDRHATVVDLEPGEMLNWPLNAPHRVENLNTVNVSMTVSYVNEDIRRAQMVHLANGLLRHRFGYQPKSRAITGASFWGKAILQKLLRDSAWVKQQRSARRPIGFELQAHQVPSVPDIAA